MQLKMCPQKILTESHSFPTAILAKPSKNKCDCKEIQGQIIYKISDIDENRTCTTNTSKGEIVNQE